MASVKIILRADKVDKTGQAPLYLRIIKNRQTKMISLRQRIDPKHWNADQCKARKSHPNSARLNAFLAEKVAEAERVGLEMETKNRDVPTKKIKAKLLGGGYPGLLSLC